jgi:hypothetical protein
VLSPIERSNAVDARQNDVAQQQIEQDGAEARAALTRSIAKQHPRWSAVRKILRSTPSFTGGSLMTWSEIRNPQSSPEVTDKSVCRMLEQHDVPHLGSRH